MSYWDDGAGQPAQGNFLVLSVQAGVVTLLDLERRINPADSGSGV